MTEPPPPSTRPGVRRLLGRRWAGLARRVLSLRRALSLPAPRESALLVPVPGFEASLAELRDRYGLMAVPGIPAHVTLLYPFVGPRRLPGALPALEGLLADVAPFPFVLDELGRFPGVLYAAPTPAEPFVRLTEEIVRRWPTRPPYRGRFDDVVPHCTIAEGNEPAGLADDAAARLPVPSVAEEVWAVEERDGAWRRVATIPLRGAR